MKNAIEMEYNPDDDEQAVLEVLREEGRVNPKRVRDRTDIRKQYVNDALRQLRKLGIVRKVTKGLYEYVPENDDLPGEKPTRSWDVAELEDNLPNVKHDGDSLQLSCPACETLYTLEPALAVEHGSVECGSCGTEFGLLLVERGETDES